MLGRSNVIRAAVNASSLGRGRTSCIGIPAVASVSVRRKHGANRNLLRLRERGMVQDVCPPEKEADMAKHLAGPQPRVVYAGFDPTADSLHVGNLLVLVSLLHAQRAGHRVIALVGGATARVGDPSGRDTERDPMREDAVSKNVEGVTRDIQSVFESHTRLYGDVFPHLRTEPVRIVNNLDWYRDVGVLEYLSDFGRHFRVSKMLRTRSVRERMDAEGEGISFAEFAYQTFQARDWLHLLEEHGCTVQLGGSDQLGNMRAGKDLVHKVRFGTHIYGMTLPLVTTAKGTKIGKTSGGNPVWISAAKSSHFEFYQYFVRVADADAAKMLKLFTFLPLSEIEDLMARHVKEPEKLAAQTRLAQEVTRLVRGEEGLAAAERATRALYGQADPGAALGEMSLEELRSVFGDRAAYVRLLYRAGLSALDLSLQAGCFASEKDAATVISAGGFYVNQTRMTNPEEVISPGLHLLPNQSMLLRVGKRNYYVVEMML